MEKEKKEYIKDKILKYIEQLIYDIEDLKEKSKPISPENSLGRLTRLDAMGEKSINDAMLIKSELRLKKLLFVKDRVGDDNFGMCNICDDEINFERLKIVPESTVCITCANEMNT